METTKKRYESTKIIDGFSTCFRQWRAKSHCNKLHGYALKFKVTFGSEDLDQNNWVADFGFLKFELGKRQLYERCNDFKRWFSEQFDHKTIIAQDDPLKEHFMEIAEKGAMDIVFMENVGCEAFAEYVYNFITSKLHLISQNPLMELVSVECIENEKNSAIYYGS